MSKTWIIIKREFMNSVSKKSFLILTILTPFLMAALVFVPLWMASIKDTDQKLVGVIDRTGNYFDLFTNDESYQFVPVLDIAPEMRIVVEQRSSVSFTLSADELRVVLVDGKDGKKKLGTLYLYAVDLTGNLYKGRIGNVRKLLAELLAQDKAAAKGTERTALSFLNFGKKAPAAPARSARRGGSCGRARCGARRSARRGGSCGRARCGARRSACRGSCGG